MEDIKIMSSSILVAIPMISLYIIDILNYSKKIKYANCKGKIYFYKKKRQRKVIILLLYTSMLVIILGVGVGRNI